MSQRTALYRLFDDQERLLYIGIAVHPDRRWRQHARDNAETWWPDVQRKEVEWFETRERAAEAEAEAIRREGPPYNWHHTAAYNDPARGWRTPAPVPSSRASEERRRVFERGVRLHMESRSKKVSLPTLLAEKLREAISAGAYPVGSRLPGNHELVRKFGVSQPSVSRAIAQLKAEGLLEVRPTKGTFVVAVPA